MIAQAGKDTAEALLGICGSPPFAAAGVQSTAECRAPLLPVVSNRRGFQAG
jgi:hypothetical protein